MIDFNNFSFSAAPRTGSTWFMHAAESVGLGKASKNNLHIPPSKWFSGFVVTMVRNPCDWLLSYFQALSGGIIGVPEVDVFAQSVRDSQKSLIVFLDYYLERHSGDITKMFDRYRGSTVIRTEDLPWAATELFDSFGVSRMKWDRLTKNHPPINATRPAKKLTIPSDYRKKILKAEPELCDRYEYYI